MTPYPPVTDEMLIAYLDGELDAAGAAAVDAALAVDPVLVERLEAHAALSTRVRAAFAPVIDEPVPETLTALLGAAPTPVVDLAARRAAKAAVRPTWTAWGAMAACLVAGLMVGVFLPRGQARLMDHDMAARGPLAQALETQLASSPADSPVRVGVTFRDRAARYCRTFTARDAVAGLACREDGHWKVRLAVPSGQAAAGDFRTATSETPVPVLILMDELISGEALDAQQEAAAQAAGWAPESDVRQ